LEGVIVSDYHRYEYKHKHIRLDAGQIFKRPQRPIAFVLGARPQKTLIDFLSMVEAYQLLAPSFLLLLLPVLLLLARHRPSLLTESVWNVPGTVENFEVVGAAASNHIFSLG